jgi:prepilin-type N-terminal cleavage/methylation domain-containing protein
MKKGFTLIELLAVIVILAIIALIATPLILNVIDDSKKGAFKSTAYGIIETVELKYAQGLFKGNNEEIIFTYNDGVESSNIEGEKLEYKGERPKSGEIMININGEIALALHDGKYCAEKSKEECFITISPSAPELSDGMIPIKWSENKWVKANINEKWYDYDKQEWANVILVTETVRNAYKEALPGTEIKEEDVLAYLVWIPRYRYKLFNVQSSKITPQEIEIVFENKNTPKSKGSNNGEWLTHPAFTFGEDELNGFWVGKFETTGIAATPTIKPGITSLRNLSISNQFNVAKKFNNEVIYGITDSYDAHMMKNMEWGAVAYLSHSKYGKYGNSMYEGSNKEIYQNKSSEYITGSSNGTPGQVDTNTQCPYNDTIDRGNGLGACGAGASTTGNIYGIYAMGGGAYDYVMGGMYNSDNVTIAVRETEFDQTTIDSNEMRKYVDKYKYNDSSSDDTRRLLGDATGETKKWYNDSANYVSSDNPWLVRGGRSSQDINVGIFNFNNHEGGSSSNCSFRLVITSMLN